jgi:uroporphyrinogen-III synthase
MAALIRRHGGEPTLAASMREVPLEDNAEALSFGGELLAGRIDVVVFFTGVGTDALLGLLETRHHRAEIVAALASCRVAVRGPKPAPVLRQRGIRIDLKAAEPNTWRELLAVLDAADCISGKTVAVQEYGLPNEDFNAGLVLRGATLRRVPIYRWALPEDAQPLLDAIRATIAGQHDVLLFTSAQQLHNVLQVADSAELKQDWIASARGIVVASIGPTTTEVLQSAGLVADVEASPTKMGQLVKQALAESPRILERKRGQ